MLFLYQFSFIFPVCNEEKILKKQITFFINFLKKEKIRNYEIILMENGSRDSSLKIIKTLAKKNKKIKFFHLKKASYGLAIKNALLIGLGKYLVLLDLDFSNLDFLRESFGIVGHHQLIVASKNIAKELDKRPFKDRFRTKVFHLVVRGLFKYPGTDTHGSKIFSNSLLLKKTIWSCFTKYEFFDTELLIRLSKNKKFSLKEIKTKIKEIRPSRYSTYRRLRLCIFDTLRLLSCFILQDQAFFRETINRFEINADDYGLDENVDKIILSQKKAQSIKKISVLVNLLNKKTLLNLKKNKVSPDEVSLHFNLLRGKPMSNAVEVPSLIDDEGCFFSLPKFLLKFLLLKINKNEIEKELEMQLNFLAENKFKLKTVDSEQHLHTFAPIWPLVSKFVKKNNLQIRSRESTFFHLKKDPFKYLGWYLFNFFFFKKIFLSKQKNVRTYHTIITHPGTSYD